MIIYKVTNKINEKCYIGQTSRTLKIRKQQHFNNSKKSKYYFHNALRKYGPDNFKWETIYICNDENLLNKKESYYIKFYKSHWTENGYNIDRGGNGGNKLIGEDNGMYGKKHTKKTKEKISQSKKGKESKLKGIQRSEKTKKKISEKNKDNKAWNKGLTKNTDERVKNNIEKRHKTMLEKNLYKKGRKHPNFLKINESLIIKYINEGKSFTKIGEKIGVSRKVISRRVKLLKEEGVL